MTIRGLICSVDVSCGCPKSIISSEISREITQNLIDVDEIFANHLFRHDSEKILDGDEDAIEQFEDVGWRNVEATGGYDVQSYGD